MAIEGMNVEDLGSMINNIIAGICFFEYENKNLTPIFANDGFFRMLGYSRSVGMNYLRNAKMCIIPEDMPIFEQAIEDVLKDDGSVEVEFRTVTASGGLRWLQVRGNLYSREGSKYVIVTIIQDITEKRNIEEELRIQAERLHIILEAEGEKIVDYNAKTDVLIIKNSGEYASTGEVIMRQYMQQMDVSTIHKDDAGYFQAVMQKLLKSPRYETLEVRSSRFEGEYTWYKLNLTSLLGAEGYVTRIVGRMINIHEKKMQELNLRLRAKRDSLTGLNDKDAAMQLIQNAIAEADSSNALDVLMIIDLDNFKKVDDLIGSTKCASILADLSEFLGEITKGSDVVGRLDIDKFVVYIRNLSTFSNLDIVASEIVKKIHYTVPYEKGDLAVTCSVGIAVFPYHGTTYEELFDKAERAIDRVKLRGKFGYRVYDAATTMAYHAMRKNKNIAYDPEKGMALDYNTEDMVMNILSEDKVFESALESAIELITVRYKFHRGYICGNEKGSLPLSKQVQFSVHGYETGLESIEHYALRRVVYEVLYDSYKNCSVLHEYDLAVEELQMYFQSEGIKSLLYYPITSKGKFMGAIVFENHEAVQLEFEDNVMEELRSLFRILEAHVLQNGLMDRLQDFATQIEMLDNLDSYVYVINPDTYELSFINKKVLMKSTEVKIGDICYKALQHKDAPCENCIFNNMNRDDPHERHTEELFIYSLRCWCRCSASWLECKEKNGLALLNCIDISEYFMG